MPSPNATAGVAVLLPLPLLSVLDYAVPAGLDAPAGAFVRVPLGGRSVAGVVWGPATGGFDPARLRPIAGRLDVPPMPADTRAFIDWVADYTMHPPGAVLRMAMSVPAALGPQPAARVGFVPGRNLAEAGLKETAGRLRVIAAARMAPGLPAADLAREAAVSPAVVRALADAGALVGVALADRLEAPDPLRPGPVLSPDQAAAATALRSMVAADGFAVTVLEGVTGSGKTEVYFEAIALALARGRQALVLLPEIALTVQWLGRCAARFGAKPAEWHSDLTAAGRRDTWRAVAEGRARVVVGARSALFLPFPELGLIVVDEEHDPAFKQDEGVVYHARDMAVVRGQLGGHGVILASATPALETVRNIEAGRYRRLVLPERHANASLPAIAAVDLRRDQPVPGAWGRSWLSPPLVEAIAAALAAGEQAMLFLNRRGYAPLTLCRNCGHRLQCPNCTAWLVEHRAAGRLVCHHCGHTRAPPPACPQCGAANAMAPCGPGVERVAEEAAGRFPTARIAQVTGDTVAGPVAAAALVGQVLAGEIDLLVGTQILAKGHHFPRLTVVGVVDADLGLSGGDLRAAERTFQLLSQVAGRAGRAERPGRVLVQTFDPGHPVIGALVAGDRPRFYAEEAAQRHAAGMPPFGRLVAVIVSGEDAQAVDAVAAELARRAPQRPDVDIYGPAPAPLAMLRARHRRRLLVRANRAVRIQTVVRDWLAQVRPPASVRVQVDVDPYSFL